MDFWRLTYAQRHNLSATKKSQIITPQDVLKLPRDKKIIESKRITLTEFKQLAKDRGWKLK